MSDFKCDIHDKWLPCEPCERSRKSPAAPAPVTEPQAFACKPDNHIWSNQFGEDWTPDDWMKCDCGAKRWDEIKRPVPSPTAPQEPKATDTPSDGVAFATTAKLALKLHDAEATITALSDRLREAERLLERVPMNLFGCKLVDEIRAFLAATTEGK